MVRTTFEGDDDPHREGTTVELRARVFVKRRR